MSKLRSLDMGELRSLRDVLHTTSGILRAFRCQSRFKGPTDFSYNAAGDLLEDIIEWIDCCEVAVVDVAKAATPETARDAELRGWTVIGFMPT